MGDRHPAARSARRCPPFGTCGSGVAFVRGGTHIAAVHDGGRRYVWDVRPPSWMRRVCEVAGRPLTRQEWEEAPAAARIRAGLRVVSRADQPRVMAPAETGGR